MGITVTEQTHHAVYCDPRSYAQGYALKEAFWHSLQAA